MLRCKSNIVVCESKRHFKREQKRQLVNKCKNIDAKIISRVNFFTKMNTFVSAKIFHVESVS